MNSTRLYLLISFFTIILLKTTFAHDAPVHQYVVKQAYYYLENEKGPIPELRDRIGLSFMGAGDDNQPWSTGYIGVAAEREDLDDPIWGFGGAFNGWTPTVTHFWDSDNGDDVKISIASGSDSASIITQSLVLSTDRV
ncbi:MAG: hypothetical protein NTX22_09395 [Ignavibacteriales bacterium]|nr:hypothetical protein [Ignavibacteriales bacterium]